MKRKKNQQLVLLFIILLAVFPTLIFAQKKSPFSKKSILVIHSYHQGYKWTDDISQAIEERFKEHREDYVINYEYMDTKRFYSQEYFDLLYSQLDYKYKDRKPDIIITSDDNALELVLSHRDELFKGIPLVFCGKNFLEPDFLKDKTNITGVNEAVSIKENINLILKLHPETKNLFVIVENTETGITVRNKIEKIIPDYKNKLNFTVYSKIGINELLKNIKAVPQNSAILYTIFIRDSNNVAFSYLEIMKRISQSSKVPVYGTWDFNLGLGIVGGKLTSGYIQGEKAAEMAYKILSGIPASKIPVEMESPNKFMFDFNMLQKYSINLSSLPENSEIINRPYSFFRDNSSLAIQVTTIIALLMTIIILLLKTIHRRKLSEQSIRKSEEKYRSVYENSMIGIFKADTVLNLKIANPAFISMLGYKDIDELNSTSKEERDRLWQSSKEQILKDIQKTKELNGYEIKTQRKDKSEIFLKLYLKKVTDENEQPIFEGFAEDITEQKKALLKIKSSIEKPGVLKPEFLSQMSHQIRTPINTILSFTNLLRDSIDLDTDFDLNDSFKIIDRAGKRILRTINLFLDMTQIQTGSFQPDFNEFNLYSHIIEPLYIEYFKYAKEKKLSITVHNESENCNVYADGYSVFQIFSHILDNALKYTEEGEIAVRIYNTEKNKKVCVEIKDTGIGISKEFLPELFEPFAQEEQVYERKYEGNGLGLTLVKNYCDLNKAQITAQSEKGSGSLFTVTFNVAK